MYFASHPELRATFILYVKYIEYFLFAKYVRASVLVYAATWC